MMDELVKRAAGLCAVFEETREHSLDAVLVGGSPIIRHTRIAVFSPVSELVVYVDPADFLQLSGIPSGIWTSKRKLIASGAISTPTLNFLIKRGFVLSDLTDGDAGGFHGRNERYLELAWNSWAAAYHFSSRWDLIESTEFTTNSGTRNAPKGRSTKSFKRHIAHFGPPPRNADSLPKEAPVIPLPKSTDNDLTKLLKRRRSCRDFDAERALPIEQIGTLLGVGLGFLRKIDAAPGFTLFGRTSPSGGALTVVDAYVLANQVDDVNCGLHFYDSRNHQLRMLKAYTNAEARENARTFASGQHWAPDAQAMIFLVASLSRAFWKYRHHSKAYRVAILDAGHISQTLYLLATQLNLGIVTTCAINEVQIEEEFGLDGSSQAVISALAVGVPGHRTEH